MPRGLDGGNSLHSAHKLIARGSIVRNNCLNDVVHSYSPNNKYLGRRLLLMILSLDR